MLFTSSEFKTPSFKLFSKHACNGKSENHFFLSKPKIPLKREVFLRQNYYVQFCLIYTHISLELDCLQILTLSCLGTSTIYLFSRLSPLPHQPINNHHHFLQVLPQQLFSSHLPIHTFFRLPWSALKFIHHMLPMMGNGVGPGGNPRLFHCKLRNCAVRRNKTRDMRITLIIISHF